MRIISLLLTAIVVLGSSTSVPAGSITAVAKVGDVVVEVAFTDEEIHIILAHYNSTNKNKHKGKGRHKQKSLPPGIAKNLARGKPLPPGISKQSLPSDLLQALPPVMDGHEIIVISGKILLIEIASRIVRDILTDVIFD